MRVGKSRKDLTPYGREFYLLGYKNPKRNQPAEGIHDPIYSNSLLIEEGTKRVFLWSADLLELPDAVATDIKNRLCEKFQITKEHILLSVTHNHSSVRDFHNNWEFGKFSHEYYEFFVNSILESFMECEENLTGAYVKYGKKIIEGYYSNRNHKDELADNEVTVIKFFDDNDISFAGIVNWAVHSTVLPASNMYLTSDLAGNTCKKLHDIFGFYPMFINGAAADCSNRNNRLGNDFEELDRESTGLANEIALIDVDQELNMDSIDFRISKFRINTNMEKYHHLLEKTMQKIEDGNLECVSMPKSHLIEKCEEQMKLKKYEDEICLEVLDIGDLRIFAFPGELGSKFGKELKASTTKLAVVAGYTNGFHYYFLPKEEYGKSFETIGNPVEAGVPEKIVCQLMEMGHSLDKKYQE